MHSIIIGYLIYNR